MNGYGGLQGAYFLIFNFNFQRIYKDLLSNLYILIILRYNFVSLKTEGGLPCKGKNTTTLQKTKSKISMTFELTPGIYVLHPDKPSWGVGQVQSAIGNRVTVNFEHQGKKIINVDVISLIITDPN